VHEFQILAQRQLEKPLVHAHAVRAVGRCAVQDEAQLQAAGRPSEAAEWL
jgi:hypothetical protein